MILDYTVLVEGKEVNRIKPSVIDVAIQGEEMTFTLEYKGGQYHTTFLKSDEKLVSMYLLNSNGKTLRKLK